MGTTLRASEQFDVIVIGVGGMGSSACAELARRGLRVLGLEQFSLVHDFGSSHGESRIIRKAYFEHPDYVPLLHRAYELWHELEQTSGRTLFLPTGLVLSGLPDGNTIKGARLSAEQHGIELQNFTPTLAAQRFPGFVFPSDHCVAFESGAGTLLVEGCVRAQIDEAIRLGATLRDNEAVINWSSDGTDVCVRTATGEFHSKSLVLTAGAWARDCLKCAGLRLEVVRKFVGWFPCEAAKFHQRSGSPTFFFELPHGEFYGFPSLDGTTVKVAEHSGGTPVSDPVNVDRNCHPADLVRLQEFLKGHLPTVHPTPASHSICFYTLTSDRHFVIDLHPDWQNVAIAAGFSGHGFKFCPVVGEILADLVQEKKTRHPIGFLSLNRSTLGVEKPAPQ